MTHGHLCDHLRSCLGQLILPGCLGLHGFGPVGLVEGMKLTSAVSIALDPVHQGPGSRLPLGRVRPVRVDRIARLKSEYGLANMIRQKM